MPSNEDSTSGQSQSQPGRSPQEKFVLIWEALKRSLLSAEILLKNTYAELDGIARDIDAGKVIEDRAAAPLISCLGFIDFAFRFKSLMDNLPMVSNRRPDMVRVQQALESVEEARHRIQHLRGELGTNEPVDYPILGSISWMAGNGVYSMALGTPIGKVEWPSLVFDRQQGKWTAAHIYKLKNAVVDLDVVIAEMRAAYNSVADSMTSPHPESDEFKALKALKWGTTFALKMQIGAPTQAPATE